MQLEPSRCTFRQPLPTSSLASEAVDPSHPRAITYQSNGAEDIGIERLAPFLGSRIGNLLHGIQRPVVDHQAIDPAPTLVGYLDSFAADTEVGQVTGKNLDFFGAVLVA